MAWAEPKQLHPLAVGRSEREDADDLRGGAAEGEPMPVCAGGSPAHRSGQGSRCMLCRALD